MATFRTFLLAVLGVLGTCAAACPSLCPSGSCCSQYGYCGGKPKTNDAWCGKGCQPAHTPNNGCYGSGTTPTPAPTRKPTTKPTTKKPTAKPTTGSGAILTGTANLTYYSSYPSCCPGVPDYDGKKYTDTTECTEYSGCDYQGQFAAYRDLTFKEVQQTRIVAFFKTGSTNFYAGKRIRLTKGTKTIDAVIGDTCGDADCDGCCTENAGRLGYLVDLEYFTAVAFLGSTDNVDGTVAFSIFST